MQRKYNKNNIFNKIINGELPCNKVYEDSELLAFHDINPKAPVHILLITKKSFISIDDFIENSAKDFIGNFFKKAQEIAKKEGLKSYRILSNHGEQSGQIIFHIHLHILGYK